MNDCCSNIGTMVAVNDHKNGSLIIRKRQTGIEKSHKMNSTKYHL